MKTPTLREVLWVAQDGKCWICGAQMRKSHHNHDRTASLDHLWPLARYGAIGQLGTTLLAHKNCNSLRGAQSPSDDDIRALIAVYRRIPSWWLEMAARDAERQARHARIFAYRATLADMLARAA